MGVLACSIPPGANTCLLSHQPKAQNRFLCPELEAGRFWQSNSLVWRDWHAHASPQKTGLLSALQLTGTAQAVAAAEHRAGVGLRRCGSAGHLEGGGRSSGVPHHVWVSDVTSSHWIYFMCTAASSVFTLQHKEDKRKVH